MTIESSSPAWSPLVLHAQIAVDAAAQAAPPTAASGPGKTGAPLANIDGPPPPLAPAVISRDAAGRATIRAIRLNEPLKIDGRLDERVYQEVPALSGFIQNQPLENVPATESTDVWLFFDRENLYVAARCWDSTPESQWVANEMRRDAFAIVQNEHFVVLLDTFYDRRNAVLFTLSPIGGRMDGQITDERTWNGDWNPIWDFSTGRFEKGWTAEIAIPFRSLRFPPGQVQTWGVNFQRNVRWKNETSALTSLSAARGGPAAIFQVHLSATLVGLEIPERRSGANLEVKPYAISELKTDRSAPLSDDWKGDVGLDVKYGLTQNLTADFTYNTDFAQVEADEQQINLTRFNLFFPEKREFFLENQGLFQFGGAGGSAGGGGAGQGSPGAADTTPVLFYSRRIGLNQGREVPIQAGGRLTGRVGRFSLGLLNIRTDDEPTTQSPPTSFTVVRARRDVLRRSSVGAIFTGRSIAQNGIGANQAYGVDAALAFYDNLSLNAYWARTDTAGAAARETSYRGQLDYGGDRYGLQLEHVLVGEHFNPESGFVRRSDMKRSFALFRFSPRPAASRSIRKLSWIGSVNYIEDGDDGTLETREQQGQFGIEFQNSDRLDLGVTSSYEFLTAAFPIAPGVIIPVGAYDFVNTRLAFTLGQQRTFSGTLSVEQGTFYGGRKTTVGLRSGRIEVTPQLSFEPSASINRVTLPYGSFLAKLGGARVTHTITPLVFVSAFLQYNSTIHAVSTNVRLRWEYRPGSELFVVYNDERDALAHGFPDLKNRAFIVKLNRLFRL